MRKIAAILLVIMLLLSCVSCNEQASEQTTEIDVNAYTRYQIDFPKLFDTSCFFIGYAKTEKEFEKYGDVIYNRMLELDNYYDIYNDYSGINNLKTINDNAGIKPVKVSQDIIDLVLLGKEAYEKTHGAVNIAMGAVLRIWHEARTFSIDNPSEAYLPNMEQLQAATQNTDINDVIVDEKAKTVFLKNPDMSLDVGAIGKGYAVMQAGKAVEKAGAISGIINGGGNILTIGKPIDVSKKRWSVGMTDPFNPEGGTGTEIDMLYTTDLAIVTSGNYQRYFTINGTSYNHIIDFETLMPASRYAAVTILHPDSGIADMLSTALFILSIDEGKQIIKEFNAEALWIDNEGNMTATDGYKAISRELGGYSAYD